jgi:predicted phage tail protein
MTRIVGSGGGGGGGCFLGHTLVAIPGGTRRIDELQAGDLVLSFDDEGGLHEAKILKVHEHEGERVIRYTLWGGQHLDATPNHWVLNQFNAFVEIDTLGSDDCLVDANNHLRPIVGKTEFCTGTVYNLTVEGHHTFIANNIRVHNAGLGLGIAGAGGGGGGGGGKGGGGGGGASRTPTEADDSLQSVQYASVLDLLCEGEIDGIENGEKGIYLEGTPVKDAAGNANFEGYTVVTRTGTQAQSYISNAIGTESEEAVNVEVVNATPIVRTITDSDVDRVRVTLQVPSLQIIEDDGDIVGHSVQVRIQVQYNAGGYTTVVDDTISGKTSNRYQRDYMIPLSGAFPVDIKVIRVSADESSTKRQNQTYWFSYTEIIDEKLRYPNSALCYLRFDSRQFDSIPTRKYLIRGQKIQLPSNATVDTTTYLGRVTYSGVWDGTFGAATWCNDPAWCLWDLLTNTRYGASIPTSSLDRYDFYAISQYCNALVDDGKGGLEPRFSCNLLINSRDEVYNVIQEMTSLFRGIAYYGAGSLVLQQDKPTDSQYLLGPSNVVDGIFVYSGTSQKARHSVATVAWQSYDTLGEVEYEYVEDADAVAKYGIINKDIKALGCYSQGQAHRAGKWALLSEQNLTETVTFSVSIDSGIILRPGMVIDVADPMKGGTRRSGRIKSASTTEIVLDSSTNLSVNVSNNATISVLLPSGIVETRSIRGLTLATNDANVIVSPAFSEAPNNNAIWLIQTSDIESQQYRVLNVAESEDGIYGVTALQYNSSIYDAIESDNKLTARDISNLSDPPDPVSNITGTEYLYQDGQSVFSGFSLSWISPKDRVSEFRVKYRVDDDNWQQVNTTSPSIKILNTHPGTLYIQVQAYSYLNKGSAISTAQFSLVGKTAVPGNVQNLSFEAINANSGRLRWDETVDLDVKVGGKIHIRHSNLTDGSASWSNSVDLIPAKSGSSTEAIIPLVEGEVLVKFEDDGGRQSASETSIIIDLPDTLAPLTLINRREDQDSPPFQGTRTNVFYSDEFDALTLDGSELLDDVLDVDALVTFDVMGDVQSSGTYNFATTVDLGNTFSVDFSRYFVTRGYFPSDLVDSRLGEVDTWSDWDGGVIDSVNAILELRSTTDNPSSSPTWGSWQPFVNGTFRGRGFQFRTTLTSSDIAENILVDELGYLASVQRRTEQSVAAISGTTNTAVTFTHPFFTGTASIGGVNAYLPSVGITAQNMQAGDYFQITGVTGTGFTISFFDSSNVAVTRQFTWSATGYGRAG